MDDFLPRVWEMLIGRDHGPLAFRFIAQPLMAAFLAVRAGMRDARAGRPPYGWAVTVDAAHRRELVRDGWKDIGRLFAIAVAMDLVYQLIVFHWIYPLQSLIVGATLAVPPYFLLRGLTNRLARSRIHAGSR
jgi:hypothetical protein